MTWERPFLPLLSVRFYLQEWGCHRTCTVALAVRCQCGILIVRHLLTHWCDTAVNFLSTVLLHQSDQEIWLCVLVLVDFENSPSAVGNFLVRLRLPLLFSCSTLIFSLCRPSSVLSTKGFNNVPLNESYLIDCVTSFVSDDEALLWLGFFSWRRAWIVVFLYVSLRDTIAVK